MRGVKVCKVYHEDMWAGYMKYNTNELLSGCTTVLVY